MTVKHTARRLAARGHVFGSDLIQLLQIRAFLYRNPHHRSGRSRHAIPRQWHTRYAVVIVRGRGCGSGVGRETLQQCLPWIWLWVAASTAVRLEGFIQKVGDRRGWGRGHFSQDPGHLFLTQQLGRWRPGVHDHVDSAHHCSAHDPKRDRRSTRHAGTLAAGPNASGVPEASEDGRAVLLHCHAGRDDEGHAAHEGGAGDRDHRVLEEGLREVDSGSAQVGACRDFAVGHPAAVLICSRQEANEARHGNSSANWVFRHRKQR
mmetsp:Transcript_107318/g.149642  ORF Transcript_107318/g.149642 Transcript_107318/m.149642 type:complete len:262 (-) Transcript_107318:2-787(-)